MSGQTVFEAILDIIEPISSGKIFGVFGDAINPLADALRREKGERFEWIGVRHEEVAAFAASAQAKLTGKLGVCAATVGPGAIHLLNGLYDAKMDHAPVLAITGQVPRAEIGTDYHQEVNLDRLFDDVCVYNQTVYSIEQMPRLALLAAQKALACKGIAHLCIPSDIGPDKISHKAMEHPIFQLHSEITPIPQDLQKMADILNESKKVTLLVGWGCRGASKELEAVAKKLQAPIVHALKGKAVLNEDHPYWVGGLGLLGSKSGIDAVDGCDTLLMLGTDFPYRQFYPKGKRIIQIDISAERLGRRCGVELGLIAHVRPTLEALESLLQAKTDDKHLQMARKHKAAWDKHMLERAQRTDKKHIQPQTVAHLINQHANDDALFTADTGETIIWMARQIHMRGNRDFIASFNLASMANAMSQALGLQALDRNRQVVAMCGDGGFSMLMADFITAVTYNLPIKVVVFNNGVLGLVKLEMQATGHVEWGVDLKNPNFADCAKAMGGHGIRVEKNEQLEPAIKEAFATPGPVVVDVLTDRDALMFPSRIEAAKAWGYSISKMKEFVINT